MLSGLLVWCFALLYSARSEAIVLVEFSEFISTDSIDGGHVRMVHVLFLFVNFESFLVFAKAGLEALLLNFSALRAAKIESACAVSVRHLGKFVPGELTQSLNVLGIAHVNLAN